MASNRNFEIQMVDNTQNVISEFERSTEAGLEKIGQKAEGYAAALCPVGTVQSTNIQHYNGGTLRQSITHKVVNKELYIGSNLYYAPFVELGTGIYADNGRGRRSPWVWRDKNGDFHWTRGIHPQHFLRKAVSKHNREYKKDLKDEMKA